MRILVIGAGIGGLTAAIALRAAGFDATVFERESALESVAGNSSIHLWTNGFRGLQRLGLGERLEEVGAPLHRAQLDTVDGRRLVDWPVDDLVEQFGAPCVGIFRADLHSVVRAAVPDDAFRLGRVCVGYEQTASGVTARFDDGTEEQGDALIGADGLGSTIRRQMLDDGPPASTGRIQWQATLTPPAGLDVPRLFRSIWGRGTRFCFYPVPGGFCWYMMAHTPERASVPLASLKRAALARVGGWPTPCAALIEATPEEAIARLELVGRRPGSRWIDGAVALLGDAAHAMPPDMGQGSSQAIEDALVLARCLARSESDVAAGLLDYQEERLDRVNRVAKLAWAIARLGKYESRPGVALRNALIRAVGPGVAWRATKKDMAYEF
jgi:2-polyprenyl-6-methoxyphenol hydroxylase-like FAD-dependent oxidoreductase